MATSTTYLERTFAAGDRRKWTWSAWVKRANLGSNNWLFHTYLAGNNENSIFFTPDDQFAFSIYTGNNNNGRLTTNRKFRDTSGWYHLQCVWDSANSTAGNRMRMYVNGVEETSFATDTNPPLNYEPIFNSAINHTIGQYGSNDASMRFSGSMSHVHFSDGYALAPTIFGEYDANGVWKIKTSPSFTLGTNGFTILKDGNTITDQSSNSNNWSASGTLTKTEDNPSNVFATWNGIADNLDVTLSNGNTSVAHGSNIERRPVISSLGNSTGKFYAEFKPTSGASGNIEFGIVTQPSPSAVGRYMLQNPKNCGSVSYINNGHIEVNNASSTVENTYTANDIIGVAVDMDNKRIYFYKNGTLENSGGTDFSGITVGDGNFYFCNGDRSGTSTYAAHANFGNGYFGTTAVSSAGTNASGNGIFEYDVPTGYTALSTKGLNL